MSPSAFIARRALSKSPAITRHCATVRRPGMDAETVTSALRAASKVGSAAVVIIEVCDASDDPSSSTFVFQRKTAGYPAAHFVGSLCLFGGNAEKEDATARATLERELAEELPDAFVSVVMANARAHGRYLVADAKGAYAFIACAFAARIRATDVDVDALVTDEGELAVLSVSQCGCESFAWSYDRVFRDYLVLRDGPHDVVEDAQGERRDEAVKISDDADVGEMLPGM